MRIIVRTLALTLIAAGTAGAQGGAPRRPVPPAVARVRAERIAVRRAIVADRIAARRIMAARRNVPAVQRGRGAPLVGMRAGMRPGMGPAMRGGRGAGFGPQARLRMAGRIGARRALVRDRIANLTPEQRNALREHRDAARTERRRIGDAVRAGTMTREQAREQLRTWREQHRPPDAPRRPEGGAGAGR